MILVHRIQVFINYLLNKNNQLISFDRAFLAISQGKYKLRNQNEILNQDELIWLQSSIMKRWPKVADTVDDYTFNTSELSDFWIELAEDLGAELGIPYLFILIPPLNHPNNLSNLSYLQDIFKDNHLFLATDNISPCSTLDLFKTDNELMPFSLVELFRISAKANRESKLTNADNTKTYLNFWDFLLKEKIPLFQASGKLSSNILGDLNGFLNAYMKMQTQNTIASSKSFYKQLNEFSLKLANYPAADVNHLYGIAIKIHEKKYYLIEILVDCLLFSDDLNEKLLALFNWQQQSLQEIRDLFLALRQGDLLKVIKLLSAGVNINVVDEYGQGVLHVVSDFLVAEYLIKKGAALNIKNELGNTPLHIAAHQQYNEIHQKLSNCLLAGKRQRFDNLAIMQSLLKRGANPNEVNHFGFTALHLVVSCHHNCFGNNNTILKPDYLHVKRKVALLCKYGADPKLKTNSIKFINTKGHYQNKNFNIYDNSTMLDILNLHAITGDDFKKQSKIKREIAKIVMIQGIDPKDQLSLLHACAKSGDLEGLDFWIKDRNCQLSQLDLSLLLTKLYYWQSDKDNWEKSGKDCAELLLYSGADSNYEKPWTININIHKLPAKVEVNALFENDNDISRKLKLNDEYCAPNDRPLVFYEKWKAQGYPCLSATLYFLPEVYPQLNPFIEICDEAIEYLRNYRESELKGEFKLMSG
jgi:ankyrin repeat protein